MFGKKKKDPNQAMIQQIRETFGATEGSVDDRELSHMIDLVGGSDTLMKQLVHRTNSYMESQLALAKVINDGMAELKAKQDEQKDEDATPESAINYIEFQGQMKGLTFGFAMMVMGTEKVMELMDLLGDGPDTMDAISTRGVQLASRMLLAHTVFEDALDTDGVGGATDLLEKMVASDGDLEGIVRDNMMDGFEKLLRDSDNNS
jgi:hypothetical protein